MSKIRVGVIGLGGRATSHCKAIRSNDLKLIAVADPQEHLCKKFMVEYAINKSYNNHLELIKDDEIDAVVITLGHQLHHKLTVDCCNAGKHVLVEKPMALSLEHCDEMISAARNNNVVLQVGLSQRYYGTSIKAKEILDSNEIGPIISASCFMNKNWGSNADDYSNRRPQYRSRYHGGGMWLTNGVHVVDRLSWVIGSQASSVSASVGNKSRYQAADDYGSAFIRYKNGVTGHAQAVGYLDGAFNGECYVIGTKGSLRFSQHPEKYVKLGKKEEWIDIEFDDPPNEAHNEWLYFNESITRNIEPSTHGEWGKHIMEILFAAEQSSITSKEVFLNNHSNYFVQTSGDIVSGKFQWI